MTELTPKFHLCNLLSLSEQRTRMKDQQCHDSNEHEQRIEKIEKDFVIGNEAAPPLTVLDGTNQVSQSHACHGDVNGDEVFLPAD